MLCCDVVVPGHDGPRASCRDTWAARSPRAAQAAQAVIVVASWLGVTKQSTEDQPPRLRLLLSTTRNRRMHRPAEILMSPIDYAVISVARRQRRMCAHQNYLGPLGCASARRWTRQNCQVFSMSCSYNNGSPRNSWRRNGHKR